jgi:hypothetical protein
MSWRCRRAGVQGRRVEEEEGSNKGRRCAGEQGGSKVVEVQESRGARSKRCWKVGVQGRRGVGEPSAKSWRCRSAGVQGRRGAREQGGNYVGRGVRKQGCKVVEV